MTECTIERVLLDSVQRTSHIKHLLELDGIGNIAEDKNVVYCAIPLTGATGDQRKFIGDEHDRIKRCIAKAGLKIYDPKDSGTNPWIKLSGRPQEVYDLDTVQVVTPRFFEFTNVFPSTGAGIEQQKAITYMKIPVVVTKAGVYTSRMSTGARRIILIEYSDADSEEEITGVFKMLKEYEPGIGTCGAHGNTILGFKEAEKPTCLPGLISESFPTLVYDFDKYLK